MPVFYMANIFLTILSLLVYFVPFCFQAYASGCDIVILGSDFERLQIIPGAKHGNIQVGCVDCSMQQGKVCNLIMRFVLNMVYARMVSEVYFLLN